MEEAAWFRSCHFILTLLLSTRLRFLRRDLFSSHQRFSPDRTAAQLANRPPRERRAVNRCLSAESFASKSMEVGSKEAAGDTCPPVADAHGWFGAQSLSRLLIGKDAGAGRRVRPSQAQHRIRLPDGVGLGAARAGAAATIGGCTQDSTNDAALLRRTVSLWTASRPCQTTQAQQRDDKLEHTCSTATRRHQLRQKGIVHGIAAPYMQSFHNSSKSVAGPSLRDPEKTRTNGGSHLIIDQEFEEVARVDHEVEQTVDVGGTMLPP